MLINVYIVLLCIQISISLNLKNCHWVAYVRLIPIGLFLNGCAGAVTSVGATVLSESWFPPTQRTTATVFYLVSAAVGGSLVFIVGKTLN